MGYREVAGPWPPLVRLPAPGVSTMWLTWRLTASSHDELFGDVAGVPSG